MFIGLKSYRFIINEDNSKPEIVAVTREITEKKALKTGKKKTQIPQNTIQIKSEDNRDNAE